MDRQWPVKILLVHPKAPFLNRDRLTIAADCTVLVSGELAERYRRGEPVIIGCPLLENPDRLMEKLSLVVEESPASQLDVYTMEVPCCHVIHMMVARVIGESGRRDIKTSHYIVRVMSGNIEPYKPGHIDESMIEAERRAHGH